MEKPQPREDWREREARATDCRNNGQTDEAVILYHELANEALSAGETIYAAGMAHMAGVSCKVANDKPGALHYLKHARKMYDQAARPLDASRVKRDEAIVHAYDGDYATAERELLASIMMFSIAKPKGAQTQEFMHWSDELGITQVKLGENYIKLKKLDEAEKWLNLGAERLERGDQWFYKATAKLHRGELAYHQGDIGSARDFARQAIDEIDDSGEAKGQHRRLVQMYGLIALCDQADGVTEGEALALTGQYLNELDEPSRRYLLDRTDLAGLGALQERYTS